MHLKIGSRKSPLALAQARQVAELLGVEYEIVGMTTSGDQLADQPLAEAGGKGLFTKELEEALLDGRIDIAVHSMKDVATLLPPGLHIPCVLPREDVHDVLISKRAARIANLPHGASFGTSSLRRAAQLLHMRPDLRIVPLRGNVGTRLAKINMGVADATMLARAGLNRLKLENVPAHNIPVAECLPAVAQGAIGIECRKDRHELLALLSLLHCASTFAAITCERAFLKVLDGSCRTPIAGYAKIEGGLLNFEGLIVNPDGTNMRRTTISGNVADSERLGVEAGKQLRGL